MKKGALVLSLGGCKNSCVFCSDSKGRLSRPETAAMRRGLEDEISWLRSQGAGSVEISGQDPIEYPGIAALVRHLKKLSFPKVALLTHGRDLSRPGLAGRLARAGLDEIRIPVYGSRAGVHDAVTLSPGSFAQTLRGISNLAKEAPRIRLVLTTLVLKQNAGDILRTVKLLCRHSRELNLGVPFPKGYVPYAEWAVPFSQVRSQLLFAKKFCMQKDVYLHFLDIPYCVFGFAAPYIQNYGSQPAGTRHVSAGRAPVIEAQAGVPAYRRKVKMDLCRRCRCDDFCDGYLEGYVGLFGRDGFKPINP